MVSKNWIKNLHYPRLFPTSHKVVYFFYTETLIQSQMPSFLSLVHHCLRIWTTSLQPTYSTKLSKGRWGRGKRTTQNNLPK